MAKKRIDINVQSNGMAGTFISGGAYIARAYDESGNELDYAYGGTEHEARSGCVQKMRSQYGSDAEILY